MLRRSVTLFAAVLALAFAAFSVRAADDLLKLVPGNALAFGAVNHIAAADAKIQKLAALVHAPAVSVLDLVKQQSGAKNGVDDKGAVGFIVLPGKSEKEPAAVLFVAVSDYKAFLGNFQVEKAGEEISEVKTRGEEFVVAHRGGYAVMTEAKSRAALEAVLQAKETVAAEAGSLAHWLAENDGSMVATSAGIKLFSKLAAAELAKAQEAMKSGGENVEVPDLTAIAPVLDVYRQMIDALGKNVTLASLGVRVDAESAVRLIARAKLVSGGEVTRSLAELPAATDDLLAGLPGGPFVMAGGGINPGKLFERYMNFSMMMLKNNQKAFGYSPEQADKMQKLAVENMGAVRAMSMCMKLGKRGEPMMSNIYATMRVENAQEYIDKMLKSAAAMNELLKDAKEGFVKPAVVTKIEIAGKPAVQQEMTFDFSKLPGMANNPMGMNMMFGPGGKWVSYYAAIDDHTIFMGMGIPKERMAAAMNVIKDAKKALAADTDVAVTKALLPAGAQGVMYISISGYAAMMQRMVMGMMQQNGMQEQVELNLPQFPRCPPIGFAVKSADSELQVHIAVPPALIKAVGEYFQLMPGMMMNRPQPPAP